MTKKRSDDLIGGQIPVPDAAQRERESVRRAVQRNASGNTQLAHGKFITPRDKDLRNLAHWK